MRRQRTPPMLSRKGMGDLPSVTLGLPQHSLGNFEKGNAQTESTIVAGWLTSGLEIAMHRMGWNLLLTRQELTKLNSEALYHHFHYGYPHCHEDERPYQKYGNHVCKEEE